MLDIRDACKTFEEGSPNENRVLQDLNLHLDEGELVTVIGSNGAGKSTLFNVIAGNELLDSGKIILDGKDISYKPEHQRARIIGRLFQNPGLGTAPDLTIEENLALAYSRMMNRFPLALATGNRERSFFKELLSQLDMGLESRLKTKTGALSGGQRQALTLLMATLVPPKLLLLDEHTAALDPVAARKIINLTNEICARHTITTLMVTHNVVSALEMGNRTIMMHHGTVVMDLKGEQRKNMSVEDLLHLYKNSVHETLNTDRIIFEV